MSLIFHMNTHILLLKPATAVCLKYKEIRWVIIATEETEPTETKTLSTGNSSRLTTQCSWLSLFSDFRKYPIIYRCVCCHFSGAVCASGPIPLPRLTVVSKGQEREGRRLLVCQGHCTSVQQVGQRGVSIMPLPHKAAQPAEGSTAGEMDQCGRGQWWQNHKVTALKMQDWQSRNEKQGSYRIKNSMSDGVSSLPKATTVYFPIINPYNPLTIILFSALTVHIVSQTHSLLGLCCDWTSNFTLINSWMHNKWLKFWFMVPFWMVQQQITKQYSLCLSAFGGRPSLAQD